MKSVSQVPRELASNWVYKVHAWRGKSPEFMQAQVSRLEAVIREAMQKAFEVAATAGALAGGKWAADVRLAIEAAASSVNPWNEEQAEEVKGNVQP